MDWLGYLIGAATAAFVFVGLFPLIRAWLVRGRAVPGLDALLFGEQRRAPRLLAYFWGPICEVCHSMAPIIDQFAAENRNVIKVNIAGTPGLARQFGVMATPSLVVVEQGVIRQMEVGGRTEPQIHSLLPS